jgi:hypothetical protein
MTGFLVSLLVVAATGVVITGMTLLARYLRRHGRGGPALGAAMAAYDEVMHPVAYDAFVEVQAQDDRVIPVPAAGER